MSLDALTKQLGIYSGVVSIEEQEINIELNIESDEDGVPLDTTASPEAEMLDAGEDEAALDETTDAQEDLEEAHDALEALAISIEQYRLSGGMSPAIAEEKYKLGLLNSVDYLIQKTNLITSESKLLQAKYSVIFSTKVLDFYKGISLTL